MCSTDAGQFAMIETVTPKDKKVIFEFVAAVPADKDLSKYDNGIGPLSFESLRLISFPGGQQYGEISPCEMNEFRYVTFVLRRTFTSSRGFVMTLMTD